MYFDLTDEQKMLQASLRTLLADTVDSTALTRATPSEIAALRKSIDARMAEMGIGAILAPATHGGLGLGLLTLAAASEECGRGLAPSAAISNALAAWLIAETGDNAQRADWLEPLMHGGATAAFAFSVAGDWSVEGPRVADGVISCERHFVEAGGEADLFVVNIAGGLGLVPRSDAVSTITSAPLDISRPTASVTFSDARVSVLDATPDTVARLRQAQFIVHAADAYGAGAYAHEMSVDYAQERRQFDRPIGAFQAIKHQLADSALLMAPARFLPWRAAHAWDTAPTECARLAALAKAHTPEVAVTTARAMVEAHGGVGYTWEYPLHLYLKRAMYDRVAWGGPAFHRAEAARFAAW